MSSLDWIILLLPLSLVFFMAYRSRRYIHGVADYLAAGRVCGRYVIAVSDITVGLAVVTLVSQVEANYKTGIAIGFWSGLLMPITMLFSLTGYCLYRYRETRALSIGQFLEMRYSRSLRIFAATLRTFSETVCNMIVPAVSARFFIYLLGLPYHISIFGREISTFAIVIVTVLTMALFIIWCGGTVALVITDAIQALMTYPIFTVFVFYILTNFSWFSEIAPVMADRVAGESFLNPFDIESLRDFNLFALLVTIMSRILNQGSWIGAGSSMAGRTPHEQKMAGVLGEWRNGFSLIFYFLIGAIVLTTLNHAHFASKAREIRAELCGRVADEIVARPEVRKQIADAIEALPEQIHRIGTNEPLSQQSNLDSPYLDSVHEVLGDDGSGNAKFQEFRTLYHQLMLPMTMRHVLPVGLFGLFMLLMVMLMISTDDSRIFSGALTTVQDIIMPFISTSLSPQRHILLVRLVSIGIGIAFFCGSFFMAQLDYINLFCIITTSIWLGGAGPMMIGGLYTRFGTTAGAYASLISGIVISGGGILLQRYWAGLIYPFLAKQGWTEPVGVLLETVSSPLAPYIVWQMDPVKFPINSNEIFFLSMVTGIILYCGISFLTCRKPFNLDRMLHRGIYGERQEQQPVRKARGVRALLNRLAGIDEQYSHGDKVIAWSVFLYAFGYTFMGTFIAVIVWNWLMPWPLEYWSYYFLTVQLLVPSVVAAITSVWFLIGGIVDLRRMFRDLAARIDNPFDNGMVEGHVSLADKMASPADCPQRQDGNTQ